MASNKNNPPTYRLPGVARNVTAAARIQFQKLIRTKAPSSSVYAQVKSTLDSWNAATDTMADLSNQVQVAAQSLHQLRTQLGQATMQYEIGERAYRGVVVMASANQPLLIDSLGYPAVTGHAAAASAVGVPTDLVVVPGVDPGAVHLKWKSPKGIHSFAVQVSVDPVTATSWSSLPGTSRRTLKVGDLISGHVYWFRVASVGAGQQSGFCAQVSSQAR